MCMETEIEDTITARTAFDGSDLSRIAGHNDCFVSSSNDVGTYKKSRDKQLWRAETNYVSMGGETCDAPEHYCNCDATFENLEEFHWSYLNSDYNTATHAVWKDGGPAEYTVGIQVLTGIYKVKINTPPAAAVGLTQLDDPQVLPDRL